MIFMCKQMQVSKYTEQDKKGVSLEISSPWFA